MSSRPYTVHLSGDTSTNPAEAEAAYADALDAVFGSGEATLAAWRAGQAARQGTGGDGDGTGASMTPAQVADAERWDQADIAAKSSLYHADPVALKQVVFAIEPR